MTEENKINLNEALSIVLERIHKEGWVAREDIIKQLGLETYGRIEALLLSSGHITKVERGEPLRSGLEFTGKKLLKKNIPEIIKNLGLETVKPREKQWGDYIPVKFIMTFTNKVLGSQPDSKDPKSNKLYFHRTDEGNILLPSGCFRGMIGKALPLSPIQLPRYAKDKILFSNVILNGNTKVIQHRTIAPAGSGFREHEALPQGTKIEGTCLLPLSHIDVATFMTMMINTGQYIGFSPACSNQGYGRFTITLKE